MSFFEVEFPTTIGYKAVGGPGFSTVVNQGFSGAENRNRNWANSRGKWTISITTPSIHFASRAQFLECLESFFLAVGGKADAFRLKDHKDFQARGQLLGVGDGTTKIFQLAKAYNVGGRSYVRTLTKIIAPPATNYLGAVLPNTVNTYLNGVKQIPSAWTVDPTTGLVTFATAPALNTVILADCDFHYPVRFDTDDFEVSAEESDISGGEPIVTWSSLQLVEVLPPNY